MLSQQSEMAFLKRQLLEIQQLLKAVADHPLMSHALICRESELRKQLRQIEENRDVNADVPIAVRQSVVRPANSNLSTS